MHFTKTELAQAIEGLEVLIKANADNKPLTYMLLQTMEAAIRDLFLLCGTTPEAKEALSKLWNEQQKT